MSVRDPFPRPNAGVPDVYVGRERELDYIEQMINTLDQGLSARGLTVRGCRGVGKSVLLEHLRRGSHQRAWLSVSIKGTAEERFELNLIHAIEAAVDRTTLRKAQSGLRRVFSGTTFSGSIGMPFTGASVGVERQVSGATLASAVKRLRDVAYEFGVPVLLLVDEADDLSRTTAQLLHDVIYAIQEGVREDFPTTMMLAGTQRRLFGVSTGSQTGDEWSGRNWTLQRLTPEQSQELLVRTASTGAQNWNGLDLNGLCRTCAGVPRRLNAAGSDLYRAMAAGSQPQEAVDAVEQATRHHAITLRESTLQEDFDGRRIFQRISADPGMLSVNDLVNDQADAEALGRLEMWGWVEVVHSGEVTTIDP